jgi:hypothetical protein
MTIQTMEQLNFPNLHPTPTILELADRSKIKPEGVLDDVIVSLDSWEYPIDFMVLHPKSPSRGHLVILGRPWISTTNAFIGCRSRKHVYFTWGFSETSDLIPTCKTSH